MSHSMAPRKTNEGVSPTDRERVELVEFAIEILGRAVDRFAETGVVPSHLELGGGTFGPLRDGRGCGFNRKLIGIWRPSQIETETARAWHDFCNEHGYCTGDRIGADEDPANGYPPHPVRDNSGAWVVMSWDAVRAELRRPAEPRQLDLFGAEPERVAA